MKDKTCIRLKHVLREHGISEKEALLHFPARWTTFLETLHARRKAALAEKRLVEEWLSGRGIDPRGLWDLGIMLGDEVKASKTSVRERLKIVKKSGRISWRKLAAAIGMPATTLHNYVTGKLSSLSPPYRDRAKEYVRGKVNGRKVKAGKRRNGFTVLEERSNAMRRTPVLLTDDALAHFGFTKDPFNNEIASEADVFMTPQIKHALDIIDQAARRVKGMLAFYGRSGCGKTVLAMKLCQDHKRIITYDTLGEYTNGVIIEDLQALKEFWGKIYRGNFSIIYKPVDP